MEGNTLVIMAAGLGSRYGGVKQLEPVGPSGEIIMDYSIYDAIKAGFKKIIFIIRKEIEEDFKEVIGDRISKLIEVEYVIQDINDLPEGIKRPSERTKPWGTGHAVLSCIHSVKESFAVINADDYYGREAFVKVNEYLSKANHKGEKYDFCMAGFVLGNTLSENGSVTRGVCKVIDGKLVDIVETSGIMESGDKAIAKNASGETIDIDLNSAVSMNMWGFTPDILTELEKEFAIFLSNIEENPLKAEFLLPEVVDKLIKTNKAEVSVLSTKDKWFGVTYKEDKEVVVQSLKKLVEQGLYPEKLF